MKSSARAALHVLATIAVVPYVLLAAAFLLLRQAIGDGKLLSFFETLLAQATWLVPWGIIGFPLCMLLLAGLGLHSRSRWVAGLLLCLLASVSILVIVVMDRSSFDVGQLLFLLPGIAVVIFGAWLALTERRITH